MLLSQCAKFRHVYLCWRKLGRRKILPKFGDPEGTVGQTFIGAPEGLVTRSL